LPARPVPKSELDFEDLARDMAAVASATTDPVMGPLLLELADRLLTQLGLPTSPELQAPC
jgi:hypothetical protein